uniref:ADF-H domain-containing protein n=1 Tax=Trichobilharzia regenti TaxID=157069 RepID=A0AA85JH72_TRIRE|nr:unnamed protein product [Trichobilharzia regenti]
MSSGIKPTAECERLYKSLKMDNLYRYIIFTISNSEQIIASKAAPRSATYKEFKDELTSRKDTGCYAVIDYECEGIKGSNLIFVSWVCDSLPVKQKMLYASSREALKKRFEGLKGDVHAVDLEGVAESVMISKAKAKSVGY